MHMVFIDLEKAYDSVLKSQGYQALKKAHIEEKVINVIKLMQKTSKCQIEIIRNI